MKKIVLLLALVLSIALFSSCSKEAKMKKLVKEFLQENLSDPKSYEEGSWKFEQVKGIEEEDDVAQRRLELLNSIVSNMKLDTSNVGRILSEIDKLNNNVEQKELFITFLNQYKSQQDSLIAQKQLEIDEIINPKEDNESFTKCTHDFRAKNKLGAIVKFEAQIYFDKNLNIVSYNDTSN